MVTCCACGLDKGKRAFPKTQWRTRTKRCKECITSRRHVVTAYCCACGEKKKIEAFPESRWSLPREEWKCNECVVGNVPATMQWNVEAAPWESPITHESLPQNIVPIERNGMMGTNTNLYSIGPGTSDLRAMTAANEYWGQTPAAQAKATSVTPTKQDGMNGMTSTTGSGSPSSVVVQEGSYGAISGHWGQAPPQRTAASVDYRAEEDDETMNDSSKPRLDELRDKVKVSFDDDGKVFFTVG